MRYCVPFSILPKAFPFGPFSIILMVQEYSLHVSPMTTKTQTKKTEPSNIAPKRRFDDAVARFAVAEEGQIVYANDLFCAMSSTDPSLATTLIAESLFSFAGKHKKHDLHSIESGGYEVRLNGEDKNRIFHFDWITTPDQRRYLIASEVEHQGQDFTSDEVNAFASKIQNIIQTGQRRKDLPRIEEQDDLRRFLNMSHDVMIVTELDGTISRMNTTFFRLLGYTDTDIEGMKFIELFEPEDRAHINSALETLSYDDDAGDAVIDFEARVKTKSGDIRMMEWRQMERSGQFYCVGRDITDIRAHETALLHREKQLLEAESIGHMGHWHWTVGEDDIEWSEEIYRIFGVDSEEFKPSLLQLDQMVYRRDVGRVIQGFQRAIIETKDYDMEFRIKRPDGEIRYIRCEGRCQKDQDGDVIGLYGIMQDMTERILYERELREAKDSAERAYAAKSQFLANMSHELRTPLNAVIGFSEIIQHQTFGPIGNDKYTEYIDGIHESGKHLLDLISDILDMSKIEAGKYELALEQLNIVETIKMACHMMKSRAAESGVTLDSKDIEQHEKIKIVADRRAFLQIMLNLLSNAVKFTNEGGSVTVACQMNEKSITVTVSDTGIGIPANKLHQITRPFEQVSSSYTREHDGSGLGLAITKELIEMHKGSLNIDSAIGQGTTVTVRMPLDPAK